MTDFYNPVSLTSVKAGITRLRPKGGASPESLFELLNGYVTAARTMHIRQGSLIDAKLPAGTKGLCAFLGKLWVFSHTSVAMPSSKYQLGVVIHPTTPSLALKDIHFAEPFVGSIYVVAEFTNGDVYHYWLQTPATWTAGTMFFSGGTVSPTVDNGYAYKATRLGNAYPAWAPNVVRVVGDRIEPSVYNGFYYEVTAAVGTLPRSGLVEPQWPPFDGATVLEEVDANAAVGGTTTETIPPEPGAPPSGGGGSGSAGDLDPYCVAETAWLSAYFQARDYRRSMPAALHSPELGFHIGECKRADDPQLVRCVRIVTETASLIVSRTAWVNYANAVEDLSPDTSCQAPNLLGRSVLVETDVEEVIDIVDVGYQWVKPLNFGDTSFGASEHRDGRRIYTHNIRFKP